MYRTLLVTDHDQLTDHPNFSTSRSIQSFPETVEYSSYVKENNLKRKVNIKINSELANSLD